MQVEVVKNISLYLAVSVSARCQKAKVVADTYSTKSATLSTQTVYLAEFSITCENEEQVQYEPILKQTP